MFGLDEAASAVSASSLSVKRRDITTGLHTAVPQAAAGIFLLLLVPGAVVVEQPGGPSFYLPEGAHSLSSQEKNEKERA